MGRGVGRRLRRWLGAGLSGAALQLLPPVLPPILPEGPVAGTPQGGRGMHGVHAASTGDRSERLRAIPITRERGAATRSVISMKPRVLGPLRAGDELRVSAELEVSTTCVDPSPRCHGRRYRFSPLVAARLVLGPGPGAAAPRRTAPVSGWRELRCSQRRPNRNHHCMLVFPLARKGVGSVAGLPCPRDGCHLNLLARAHHPRARRGNLLVIGGDEASGRIVQDKGRVNVVRLRRDAVASVTRHVRGSSPHRRVPVRSGDRRVVRSVPLPGLEKGEHFEVRGAFVAALGRLPYNALISSHMVVAPSRTATHPRDAARVISLRGKLSEVNGYNCTHGPSAHRTPCVTRKAGVATVKRDPRKVLGPDPDLYVNLVARSQPKLARARQGHRVRVRAGRMVVTRYGPPRG